MLKGSRALKQTNWHDSRPQIILSGAIHWSEQHWNLKPQASCRPIMHLHLPPDILSFNSEAQAETVRIEQYQAASHSLRNTFTCNNFLQQPLPICSLATKGFIKTCIQTEQWSLGDSLQIPHHHRHPPSGLITTFLHCDAVTFRSDINIYVVKFLHYRFMTTTRRQNLLALFLRCRSFTAVSKERLEFILYFYKHWPQPGTRIVIVSGCRP